MRNGSPSTKPILRSRTDPATRVPLRAHTPAKHVTNQRRAPLDFSITNTFVQWTGLLASGLIVKRAIPTRPIS